MKPSKISRKRREYLKCEINELTTNSKNKNVRDLYTRINEFRKATNLEKNLEK
jgi:hypothetical protein